MDARDSGRRPWTAAPTEKVFEIYIRTTPERLWEAITDPQLRPRYSFGLAAVSDWKTGSRYELSHPQAGVMAQGENLEVGGSCRASPRCGARKSETKANRV